MLKIKDNVDLKELEKFGLKPHYILADQNKGTTGIDFYYSCKYECKYGYLRLKPKRKILFLWFPCKIFENNLKIAKLVVEEDTFLDIDLLYDLIKADLVEKVEE